MDSAYTSDSGKGRRTGSLSDSVLEGTKRIVSPKPYGPAWTPSQFKPQDAFEADEQGGSRESGKKTLRKKRSVREYTLGEEIANSITHGIGALLAVAALIILIVVAAGNGSGIHMFAALVYGITMILEYTMSTLYHAITSEKAKRVFKVLDHSCIYLFIAGSYTPFCLITLAPVGGIWLCVFVWGVALLGVAAEAFWVFRPRWISAVLYLLLGWSVVWFLPALAEALPSTGLWLLLGGGICYSLGCIFYVLKKIPYMHSLFHVWVLAGTVCQFLAIVLYVM